MHVILLARETLEAVGVSQCVQLALVVGNVAAALLYLSLEVSRLVRTLDLPDQALVTDEQKEHTEYEYSDCVLVQYPFAQPRMIGNVLLYVGELHCLPKIGKAGTVLPDFPKKHTKLQKIFDICKYYGHFFYLRYDFCGFFRVSGQFDATGVQFVRNKSEQRYMKKVLIIAGLFACMCLSAQTTGLVVVDQPSDTTAVKDSVDGFRFTMVDSVAITPVKDQNRSSTCWAFSTIGFLESELLRMGKGEYDLSEMFVVSKTMMDRATYFVRQYGDGSSFAPGGSAYDVIYCMSHYGLVPQEAMPGIRYGAAKGDTLPVHSELDAVAGGYLKALTSGKLKKLTPVWKEGLQAIYDTYLGACPEEFTYKGKKYTPKSFAESLGLKEDDYVSITSYTHHPFYERFALEVPDNWRMDQMYNIPIDELIAVIDNAIAKGYTLAWGADVSEDGFTRKGIGVMPDADNGAEITGSDMAHWLGLKADQRKDELTKRPLLEVEVTQQMRQDAYDRWETTDDHGMQIFGIAHDQNGKKYYMVKNSWGTARSDYKGIWYVSEAFMRYKTNDILVHKDALPKDIKKKMGVK